MRPRYLATLPYLGAVGLVAVAFALRWLADPLLDDRQPFAMFLIAVIVAGRFCGFAPSLLTLVLGSLVARYFFVSPRGSFDFPGWDHQSSYAFSIMFGIFFAFLMRAEQKAKAEARRQATAALQKQRALEQEITERIRIEAELQASQERFQSFMNRGPFAAFMKDEEGKFVYVNRFCADTFGRDPADFLGKTNLEIFPVELAREYIDSDRLTLSENTPAHFEDTTSSLDGRFRHWSTVKFSVPDGQGRRLIGGVSLDVTAFHEAEERAKDSEARLILALEAGRLGIWSWDLATNRMQSSELQAVMHGRTSEQTDMILDDSLLHIHPDDEQLIRATMASCLRNDPPERITYRVVPPDGGIRWIESVGKVFCDEAGRPIRVMGISVDITERKQAEIALRAQEAELQKRQDELLLALDAARMGTWTLNPITKDVTFSEAAEGMLGYKPGEFPCSFEDFLAAVHPEDRAGISESIAARIQGDLNHQHRHQFRVVLPDGRIRWLESQGMPQLDPTGIPVRIIGVTTDITERKQAEIAIQAAEERFRVLATKAPVGIFQADPNGQNIFTNQRWCEMAGLTPEEILGSGWKRAIHPGDLSRLEQEWDASVAARREWSDEFRIVHRNGEISWVLGSSAAIRDVTGEVTSFIGTVIDVTERYKAQESLRAREAQLSGILDNTTALVFLKDPAGRYLLTNAQYKNHIEIAGVSILGKTDTEYFPESIAHAFQESDATVWREQIPIDFEEVAFLGSELHTFRAVKFPVRDEMGKMIALGGIATDITDLKAVHETLKKEREFLRNLIEVQENEKQFLCHEFHDGLIQFAVGSLFWLESYQNKHPSSEASAMIDLVISKLRLGVDDGRRVIRGIRPAVLDDSGLEAAIVDLIGQFSASGVMITSKCDPNIGRLRDSVQTTVYRVVQEAINNAVKHSGTDVVRIELMALGGELQLEIRDFGCGFDVPASRKKGFGLVGMTERVRLQGGECLIQSELEGGTHISVRMPISLDKNDA